MRAEPIYNLGNPEADGGPAFPRHELSQIDGTLYAQHGGMTLRDWFAGQALAGLSSTSPPHTVEQVAKWAYDLAALP